jgi:uncharacterized membrane protein YbjE (DUF340 family)
MRPLLPMCLLVYVIIFLKAIALIQVQNIKSEIFFSHFTHIYLFLCVLIHNKSVE